MNMLANLFQIGKLNIFHYATVVMKETIVVVYFLRQSNKVAISILYNVL